MALNQLIDIETPDLMSEFFDEFILPSKPYDSKEKLDGSDFNLLLDDDNFFTGPNSSPSSSSSCSITGNIDSGFSVKDLPMFDDEFMPVDIQNSPENDIVGFNDDSAGSFGHKYSTINKKKSSSQKTKLSKVSRHDNVQLLADLNSPLTKIRSDLEKRLKVDLREFTIWLQNKICLEDHSTLSEQCIEGTGVVKVLLSIQPHNSNGLQKINIVDVVKVDKDYIVDKSIPKQKNELDNSDNDKLSSTQFVESSEFKNLLQRFSYPTHMSDWTRLHTLQWAKWVNRTFQDVNLTEDQWTLDGQELAAISKDEFCSLVHQDPGDLLWQHFSLLRQTGVAKVPQKRQISLKCSETINTKSMKRTLSVSPVSGVTVPKKPRVILGKYEEAKVFINTDESSNVHRSGNNGSNIQLWKFLLDILTDYKHRNAIRWSLGKGCFDGEFIMTEPESVARLWGQQKGKPTMNYEKLSRALRYYKGGNILDKVHNKKFTYRFVCDLRELVGFSAQELDQLVKDQLDRS